MGFVSFFTTGRSYASPSFILVVPVDAIVITFMGERCEWDIACLACG